MSATVVARSISLVRLSGPAVVAAAMALGCVAAGTGPVHAQATSKRPDVSAKAAGRALVFALTNSGDATLASLLDHAGVDGVALQEGWARIEARKDEYSFAAIDGAIEKARARGKRVTLHLMASPRTPDWLAAAGAAYYTGTDIRGNTVTDVVPWDPVYLERYSLFLRALARHLAERGTLATIFDVSAVVPVSELNLVACRDGKLGEALAYDRSKYLSAWKQMVDVLHEAFPGTAKFVSPAVNDLICAPERDASFYRDLMSDTLDLHGTSFWVFAADLNADGSQRTRDYLDIAARTSLGYQTIWSATDDPTGRMGGTYPGNLAEAVRKALSNGASYLEIYAADVRNPEPAIQDAIRLAHGTAAPSSTWIVPSSAHLAGTGGSFYTTDLVVANTGSSDASLTLKYLGHDVDGRDGSERTFSLAAGKSATYADLLSSLFPGADYGSIRLTSTSDALAAVALTSTPAASGGSFGQSVPAFAARDWIRTGAPKSLVGVREDGAFRTNLVLANAEETELDVDVSLVGSDGVVLGSRRYRLPALGMRQVTRVVREVGVTVDVAGARLVLSTPTADGAFSAYASVIDAATNDPRTILPR